MLCSAQLPHQIIKRAPNPKDRSILFRWFEAEEILSVEQWAYEQAKSKGLEMFGFDVDMKTK